MSPFCSAGFRRGLIPHREDLPDVKPVRRLPEGDHYSKFLHGDVSSWDRTGENGILRYDIGTLMDGRADDRICFSGKIKIIDC